MNKTLQDAAETVTKMPDNVGEGIFYGRPDGRVMRKAALRPKMASALWHTQARLMGEAEDARATVKRYQDQLDDPEHAWTPGLSKADAEAMVSWFSVHGDSYEAVACLIRQAYMGHCHHMDAKEECPYSVLLEDHLGSR